MNTSTFPLVLLLTCATASAIRANESNARPNVLFIAIDDLNDWVGCLGGHAQTQTPHIDALARRGTLFTNAHCQAPLCNPSRSSLLVGLRPSTTGIYGLTPGIRAVEATRDRLTLPQLFTASGYHTYTCGKVYHDGSMKPADQRREFSEWGPAPAPGFSGEKFAKLPEPRHPAMDWGPWPARGSENAHGDYKIASAAIKALQAAPKNRPFFIACGFRQPHLPVYAPAQYFDLYPDDTLQMPAVKDDDRADLPKFADFLHWRLPEPRLATLKEYDEWRPLVRAYLAATSFMDAQLGRVLDALEASGRADETIVVVWSDHGWHLGEKGNIGKTTLWQRSTRVPLVFAGPGVAKGATCSRPAELLDIYPTLAALCELKAPDDLEGHSLVPQLNDADAPREHPAITTHNQGNHAISTERWRYIRYADGSEELYDLRDDPHEWTNLAGDADYAETKRDLARWLPKTNLPLAPGSAHRVLTYDPATGDVTWEGKKIDKNAPLPGP